MTSIPEISTILKVRIHIPTREKNVKQLEKPTISHQVCKYGKLNKTRIVSWSTYQELEDSAEFSACA